MRQFEAKFVEDHADNNLWTVVALLLVLAALGLGIVGADTLEVRICQVVEDDSALEVEAFFLGVSQVGFDLVFGRQELVADAIVAVIGKVQDVAAEQVGEGTGGQPGLHEMLAAGGHESVNDTDRGGVTLCLVEAERLQQTGHIQLLPGVQGQKLGAQGGAVGVVDFVGQHAINRLRAGVVLMVAAFAPGGPCSIMLDSVDDTIDPIGGL